MYVGGGGGEDCLYVHFLHGISLDKYPLIDVKNPAYLIRSVKTKIDRLINLTSVVWGM